MCNHARVSPRGFRHSIIDCAPVAWTDAWLTVPSSFCDLSLLIASRRGVRLVVYRFVKGRPAGLVRHGGLRKCRQDTPISGECKTLSSPRTLARWAFGTESS
jgi:hypothetical protein